MSDDHTTNCDARHPVTRRPRFDITRLIWWNGGMPTRQLPSYWTFVLDFVVVVIGITVSFWLNEWNHDQRNLALHQQDIQSLIEDLEQDEARLEEVERFTDDGIANVLKVLEATHAYRNDELSYEDFSKVLIEVGEVYIYATFYMNSATYKSLLANGRIQLFSAEENKLIRDYYEYVSKRVDDNNDIVDSLMLEYYNRHHPYCNLRYRDDPEAPAPPFTAQEFFADPAVREVYSGLPFLLATLMVHDRVGAHKDQITKYKELRDALELRLRSYATSPEDGSTG